jgi:hypothetical protein
MNVRTQLSRILVIADSLFKDVANPLDRPFRPGAIFSEPACN